MATNVSTRISELWKELSPEDRSTCLRAVGVQDGDEQHALAALSDPSSIHTRADALSDDAADLLYELCFESGLYVQTLDPAFEAELQSLMDVGLVLPFFRSAELTTWVAPFEVRTALATQDDLSDADLALQLAFYEDETLDDLARTHGVARAADRQGLTRLEDIAAALLDPAHLEQLLASLSDAAQSLLLWMIQHDGPIAHHHTLAWIAERTEHDQEMRPAALTVLERLGFIHPFYSNALRMWSIASDLRAALLPLLTLVFNQPAADAWAALRESAQPSFRDIFPRGSAGSPLYHARFRLLRAISKGMDPAEKLDQLLREFFVFDETQQTGGALSSYQLDVQTPDAFARHMLRVWTGSLDDAFTRSILSAFEGDVHAISRWLIDHPTHADDADDGVERQLWLELLVQLRGLLLLSLSCLSPGVWYPMTHLAEYVTTLYRRTVWQYGRYRLFRPEFPHDALPVGTEEISAQHTEALHVALEQLFAYFFEVIGAAERDESGELFLVNNEAFRVFRESDQHFEGLWEAAEVILHDDIDLWLPLPNERGPRFEPSPSIQWKEDGTISLPVDAPLSDLIRLAEWGTPTWEGSDFRFVFNTQSFLEDADPDDIEELLVWLVVRTEQPLPDRFRALVPLSYTEADDAYAQVLSHARGYVVPLFYALEAWGESPSLAIMEELRSWGNAASDLLLDYVEATVERQDAEPPLLRHAAILLGEFRNTDAIPALLDAFAHSQDDRQEGAIGMALSRMGAPAFGALQRMLYDPMLHAEKRLSTAGVLTAMGVLYPHLKHSVFQHFRLMIRDEETREDVATILAIYAADLGHPDTDDVIRALQHEGRWVEDVLPFEDALWTSAISPCNWGHPVYAGPLAQIFPNVWESEEVVRAAGVDEVMRGTSVEQAAVLGRSGRWRRRT